MPAPLLALVRAAAAPDHCPPLAIGLDPATDGSGVRGVPIAGAMNLLAAARQREGLDRAAVAAALALDPDEVGGAVLLLPSRRTGWTAVEGAELAVALAGALRTVVLAPPPSSLLNTPAALAAALRTRGAEPSFLGSLPPDDDLAPGCPVAVLESMLAPAPLPTVAAVISAQRPNSVLPHTLRALAEECIRAVVIVPPEAGHLDDVPGAVLAARLPGETEPEAVARVAAAQKADWILAFAAEERPFGPWPGVGLRETIARFAAHGGDAAAATVVLHPPSDAALDRDPLRLAREWRFATGRADAGRVVLWRRDLDPHDAPAANRRSPWNLLLRRIAGREGNDGTPPRNDSGWATADEPGGRVWLPWDDGFGERFLVERLTGHGVFRRTFPTPPDCVVSTEERMTEWRGSAFTTRVVRLPAPEPLDPRPGAILLRWEAPEGRLASLFLARPGRPERFIARQPRGTVTVDLVEPNAAYYARLYDNDDRQRLLAELRFRFAMDLDE
jgi:hypothetical protein